MSLPNKCVNRWRRFAWVGACAGRDGWAFWTRVGLLALGFSVVVAFGYLNWIGLPGFLKRSVVAAVGESGVELSFGRLRLSGLGGVVADEVRVAFRDNPNSVVTSGRAEIDLDLESVWGMRFGLRGLRLVGAEFDLSSGGSSPESMFRVENGMVNLAHLGGGKWQMLEFHARTLGWDVYAHGSLANIAKLLERSPSSAGTATNTHGANAWFVAKALPWLRSLSFEERPRLEIQLSGDASRPEEIVASLQFKSEAVSSANFSAERLDARARIGPREGDGAAFFFSMDGSSLFIEKFSAFSLQLEGRIAPPMDSDSPWVATVSSSAELIADGEIMAEVGNFRGKLDLFPGGEKPSQLETSIRLGGVASPEFNLGALEFSSKISGDAPPALSSVLPRTGGGVSNSSIHGSGQGKSLAGSLEVTLDDLLVGEFKLAKGGVDAGVTLPFSAMGGTGETTTISNVVQSFGISGNVWAEGLRAGPLLFNTVETTAQWREGVLNLVHFQAHLPEGPLEGNSVLDFQKRRGSFEIAGNIHPGLILSEFESNALLREIEWNGSPYLALSCSFPLPTGAAWAQALGESQIKATVEMGGSFAGERFERARLELGLDSMRNVDGKLLLEHAGGRLSISALGDLSSKEWKGSLQSDMNLMALSPLLPKESLEVVEQIHFGVPPRIEGEFALNSTNLASLRFVGGFALTNAMFKGEAFELISASVDYQGLVAELDNLSIVRNATERLAAPHARLDLPAEVFYLTNALSTLNPYVVTALIGEKVYSAIEPYQFASVPTVRINGNFPLDSSRTADVHFDIVGEGLRWWKLGFGNVSGHVYWKGFELWIEGIRGGFYEGDITFDGYFKFREEIGDDSADFTFKALVHEANLTPLMKDLANEFSSMEGTVNGELVMTSANSSDWSDWNGHGWAEMRDGFLWGTPLFGVFTPVLDSIMPGLGTSRISAARGDYTIEKSRVRTKNLEFRAPVFRLAYEGSVDFQGQLDARAEALMFRDTWVVGRALSATLWPVAKVFETKITGNLSSPKVEFAHIPKFMFLPLKPFELLRKLATPGKDRTPAVPAPAPPGAKLADP